MDAPPGIYTSPHLSNTHTQSQTHTIHAEQSNARSIVHRLVNDTLVDAVGRCEDVLHNLGVTDNQEGNGSQPRIYCRAVLVQKAPERIKYICARTLKLIFRSGD